VELNDRKASR